MHAFTSQGLSFEGNQGRIFEHDCESYSINPVWWLGRSRQWCSPSTGAGAQSGWRLLGLIPLIEAFLRPEFASLLTWRRSSTLQWGWEVRSMAPGEETSLLRILPPEQRPPGQNGPARCPARWRYGADFLSWRPQQPSHPLLAVGLGEGASSSLPVDHPRVSDPSDDVDVLPSGCWRLHAATRSLFWPSKVSPEEEIDVRFVDVDNLLLTSNFIHDILDVESSLVFVFVTIHCPWLGPVLFHGIGLSM